MNKSCIVGTLCNIRLAPQNERHFLEKQTTTQVIIVKEHEQ